MGFILQFLAGIRENGVTHAGVRVDDEGDGAFF